MRLPGNVNPASPKDAPGDGCLISRAGVTTIQKFSKRLMERALLELNHSLEVKVIIKGSPEYAHGSSKRSNILTAVVGFMFLCCLHRCFLPLFPPSLCDLHSLSDSSALWRVGVDVPSLADWKIENKRIDGGMEWMGKRGNRVIWCWRGCEKGTPNVFSLLTFFLPVFLPLKDLFQLSQKAPAFSCDFKRH